MLKNQTSDFLGQSYSWSKVKFELEDVQPLHGGIRIYLHSWGSGPAYITRIAPGGKEKKYRISLNWNEKEQLCQLCIEQDFLTIEPENRPGNPDESRPAITVTNPKGEKHTVTKWAGVKDARFDAIYAALLQIGERTKGKKPIPKKLRPYPKAIFSLVLALTILAALFLAYRAAGAVAAHWWPAHPGWLAGLTILLTLGLIPALVGLHLRERYKARYERISSNPVFLALLNLFIFVGLVTLPSFLWRTGMLLWGETAVAQIQSLSPSGSSTENNGWLQKYKVTYTFQPEPDKSFTRQQNISQDYFDSLTPDNEIEVVYLPLLPRYSLPANNLAATDDATTILAVLFAIYLLTLGAVLAGQPLIEFIDERF